MCDQYLKPQRATTLVHKGAMDIGLHAVRTFAKHFKGIYQLEIHTDGSPDPTDEDALLRAAAGMKASIVRPQDRQTVLEHRLKHYPRTRSLLNGVGYQAKLELPMVVDPPYFYFDSDIIWLRPVTNLKPERAPNAFSTESWSWYNGVANDRLWLRAKTPRRVNSGFYYLGDPFPFDAMEEMLATGMFDSTIRYNTDQEIMAYLFRNMQLYHPDDLKRSRRNVRYDLENETCAALHFPGAMWRDHLNQIQQLEELDEKAAVVIRHRDPTPLSRVELLHMRMSVQISDSRLLGGWVNRLRSIRARIK